MRILYWAERFWPHIGGIEAFSMQLIPALQARGYEFKVVASHCSLDLPDVSVHDNIFIYRFHFLTSLTNRNLKELMMARKKIAKLKQSFKPDLVHINFSGPSTYFHIQTAGAHPSPTLITIHSLPPQRSENSPLLVRLLSSASWITTVSERMMTRIRQLMPQVTTRSSVIYNALKIPSLQPNSLPFDPPQLLCLGRLSDEKGFDLAISAFASLLDRYPELQLSIAGDGPLRADLEQQAATLGVREAVKFKGLIEPKEIPKLMNEATIVLLPSRREGFPLVALEAAQMARPVIATRVGGLPESVAHQETGLLIEKEDTSALADAIAFLLNSPDVANRMGKASRSRVLDTFRHENCVEAYDILYQRLIREFVES